MRPQGMTAFTIVWFGQVISLMGSAMSGFALTLWAWQTYQSATVMALVGFFNFAPTILFSPLAGALVDRWNRKLVMMLSDLATGLMSVIIFVLLAFGHLEIWQLYLTGVIAGSFQAFQWPAYSASSTLMVPKQQYARASGMMGLADMGSGILSPILAAALIGTIRLQGILLIDIATFIFAISVLLWIVVPQPKQTSDGQLAQGSLWKESLYGFQYIWARKPLLGLQLVFFGGNFLASVGFTLMAPMLLARTLNNAVTLGSVESVGAIGGVLGGLAITAWGGMQHKVHGVLLGWGFSAIFGLILLGSGSSPLGWAVFLGLGMFFHPIIDSSNQAIWQAKVAPDIQGKVFSVRRLIAQLSVPLSLLMAGPLADQVFEPALSSQQGSLSGVFSWLVGTGPGAGMALMLVIAGAFSVLIAACGYLIPAIRNVETLLPDHQAEVLTPAEGMLAAAPVIE